MIPTGGIKLGGQAKDRDLRVLVREAAIKRAQDAIWCGSLGDFDTSGQVSRDDSNPGSSRFDSNPIPNRSNRDDSLTIPNQSNRNESLTIPGGSSKLSNASNKRQSSNSQISTDLKSNSIQPNSSKQSNSSKKDQDGKEFEKEIEIVKVVSNTASRIGLNQTNQKQKRKIDLIVLDD
jgi:hypothetical protein